MVEVERRLGLEAVALFRASKLGIQRGELSVPIGLFIQAIVEPPLEHADPLSVHTRRRNLSIPLNPGIQQCHACAGQVLVLI